MGVANLPLVGYLVQQFAKHECPDAELANFYPDAKAEDWKLIDAGIRVQAIKKEDGDAGIVHFGTEVVTSEDLSISALLGASPGASVCVNIVLEVARKCFADLFDQSETQDRLREMIPTLDQNLAGMKERRKRFENIATGVNPRSGSWGLFVGPLHDPGVVEIPLFCLHQFLVFFKFFAVLAVACQVG